MLVYVIIVMLYSIGCIIGYRIGAEYADRKTVPGTFKHACAFGWPILVVMMIFSYLIQK